MTAVTPSCSNNSYYAGIVLKTAATVAGITLAVSTVALVVLLAAPVLPAFFVGAVTLLGFSVESAIITAIFSATFMAISLGATHHLKNKAEKAGDKPTALTRSPDPVVVDEEEDLKSRVADVSLVPEIAVESASDASSPLPPSNPDSPDLNRSTTPPAAAAAAAAVVEEAVDESSDKSSDYSSLGTSRSTTPTPEKLFDSETGFPLFGVPSASAAAVVEEAKEEAASTSARPASPHTSRPASPVGAAAAAVVEEVVQEASSSEVNHPETPADSTNSAAIEPDLTIAQVLRQEQILTDNAVGATERVPDLGFLSAV
jgi:hypothetical protein